VTPPAASGSWRGAGLAFEPLQDLFDHRAGLGVAGGHAEGLFKDQDPREAR